MYRVILDIYVFFALDEWIFSVFGDFTNSLACFSRREPPIMMKELTLWSSKK